MEIKAFGDTVRINQVGNIIVGTQVAEQGSSNNFANSGGAYGTGIGSSNGEGGSINYQSLKAAQTTLKIDQLRKFGFKVEDVLAAQANVDLMENAMSRAAYALADSVDQFIASQYTEASNTIGSDEAPIELTKSNVYENIVAMAQKLDEANVPNEGRYIVVTPWVYSLLLLDDRFVKAGTAKTDAVLATGYVGEVAGFKVYKSNNVAKGETEHAAVGTAGQDGYVAAYDEDNYKIIAGHPMAITFAQQLTKVETLRDINEFCDLVRGMLIMGAKVVQPAALCVLTAVQDA